MSPVQPAVLYDKPDETVISDPSPVRVHRSQSDGAVQRVSVGQGFGGGGGGLE